MKCLVPALVVCSFCPLLFGQAPSSTDLWNYDRGMYIVSCSHLHEDAEHRSWYNPLDVFGSILSTLPQEAGNVTFPDNVPSGSVHFIEWRTLQPVLLRSIRLFAGEERDVYQSRGFASFTLKAKPIGSDTFDLLICYFVPQHPVVYLDSQTHLVLSTNIQPVMATDFRAEWVHRNTAGLADGPRIIELDGFGETLPQYSGTNYNVSIRTAIEIGWNSESNQEYQVQWSLAACRT